MTHFEEVTCKTLGIIIAILVIVIGLQLPGCSCPVPTPPSDYIDEVNTSNMA